MDDVFTGTNIIPKQMSPEQLDAGTRWLMNRLYDPDSFIERVSVLAKQLPSGTAGRVRSGARGAEMWDRLVQGYARLGPEFAVVPCRTPWACSAGRT